MELSAHVLVATTPAYWSVVSCGLLAALRSFFLSENTILRVARDAPAGPDPADPTETGAPRRGFATAVAAFSAAGSVVAALAPKLPSHREPPNARPAIA
jgi:hypothetical protein